METLERLIVDIGRLDDGNHEHLEGLLDQAVLELNDLEQLLPAGPIAYVLNVNLLPDDALLVRGTLSLRCDCVCSRCGGDFAATFEELAYCETFNVAGKESLDLTESVRESIILALPSYPICKEDCKGVCLRCGQDLNVGSCRCESMGVESPWDALNDLGPKA
ncbi:MAG: YceD family protein [Kiritimatiellia bacterium]